MDLKNPDQGSLWENEIILGEEFYHAVTSAPVPLDLRALRGLKRSPLALDLYAWCAYNAYQARKTGHPRWISWRQLSRALGADYDESKEFARKARRELRKVQLHFPGLQLGKKRGCLEILPTSLPAIAPKALGDKPAH